MDTISVTARFLNEVGLWQEFCDLFGMNPWAMNEGRLDPEEVLTRKITGYEESLFQAKVLRAQLRKVEHAPNLPSALKPLVDNQSEMII